MGFETVDQVVDFGDMTPHPSLHQGRNRRGKEMDDGLFAAAHAGAVTRNHRLVVRLVEKQGLEGADLLVQIVDADKIGIRGRQIEPEVPLGTHFLDRLRRLRLGDQGAVVAHLDTLVAALAGVGVHRDAEESAAARLFLLAVGPIGLGDGEADNPPSASISRPNSCSIKRLLLRLALIGRQGLEHRAIHQLAHVGPLAGRIDQLAQTFLDISCLATQMLRGHAALHAVIAAAKTSDTRFTKPGIALSGQTAKQFPQAVQFSGTYLG
jgi:hypothetical protein